MQAIANLGAMDFIHMVMFATVIFLLKRFIDQYDKANQENKIQFDALIIEVKEVKNALTTHQSEVAVGFQETKGVVNLISERIETHEKMLDDLNILYDRVRINETDINVIKERIAKH
jgi:hypothetical protein